MKTNKSTFIRSKRQYHLTAIFFTFLLVSCAPPQSNDTSINESDIIAKLNDIQNYATVQIENQTWLAQNLAVTVFTNGDEIYYAKNLDEWIEAATQGKPAFTYTNFYEPELESDFETIYYNWYAVNDSRGLAPKGWKIPTSKDWEILLERYAFSNEKTAELKSKDSWEEDGNGNNQSGFNAKGLGHCDDEAGFANFGISTSWWTSDEVDDEEAKFILLNENSDIGMFNWPKGAGFSVRLVKD